jgi:hypothetical protein
MRRTLAVALLVPLAVALLLAGCTTTTASGTGAVTVTIAGGLETDPVDNGRPVVLVAGALGVPAEVFREAFSGVTPASGGDEPDPAQVQRNKAALLAVLAPYGVTNESLDAASNRYRYLASAGETWPHTEATAIATVVDGVVTGIEIVSAGSGYTSPPTITLSNGQTATAELHFGVDTATNGSISTIALD